MKLGYDLTIEQSQKLTMTPELIQAIQILQFNSQELENYVQEELMQNPVLESSSIFGTVQLLNHNQVSLIHLKSCPQKIFYANIIPNPFRYFKPGKPN